MSLQASVFFLTFASVSYHTAIMYHHQSGLRISAIRIEPVPCYARLDSALNDIMKGLVTDMESILT